MIVAGREGESAVDGYSKHDLQDLWMAYRDIDEEEPPTGEDGEPLSGPDLDRWRESRKLEAMREIMGRDSFESAPEGTVRKTRSGHEWRRGHRINADHLIDERALEAEHDRIDSAEPLDAHCRPLRGAALSQWRVSRRLSARDRLVMQAERTQYASARFIGMTADDAREAVLSESQSTRLRVQQERRHVLGDSLYVPGKSYFDPGEGGEEGLFSDLRELFDTKRGTGDFQITNGSVDSATRIVEFVDDSEGVVQASAIYVTYDGGTIPTNRYAIHYSEKKGYHVVPVKPE